MWQERPTENGSAFLGWILVLLLGGCAVNPPRTSAPSITLTARSAPTTPTGLPRAGAEHGPSRRRPQTRAVNLRRLDAEAEAPRW